MLPATKIHAFSDSGSRHSLNLSDGNSSAHISPSYLSCANANRNAGTKQVDAQTHNNQRGSVYFPRDRGSQSQS
jgi:hypothetical protein